MHPSWVGRCPPRYGLGLGDSPQGRKVAEDFTWSGDGTNSRASEDLQQTLGSPERFVVRAAKSGKRPELSFATLTLVSFE